MPHYDAQGNLDGYTLDDGTFVSLAQLSGAAPTQHAEETGASPVVRSGPPSRADPFTQPTGPIPTAPPVAGDLSGFPGHVVQSKSGETLLVDPVTGTVIKNYGAAPNAAEKAAADLAKSQAETAKTNAEANRILAGGQSQSAAAALIGHQLEAARHANDLAERQRQFNENFGKDKAEYNQNYALNQGKELLGLGSRPDTLIKYLYALRGQQTPQAIAGTTTNLPGFQNVVGQPNPTATLPFPAVSGAAGASPLPPSLSAGAPNPLTMGTPEQNARAQQNATNQTAANPSLAALLRTTPSAPAPSVDPFASTRPSGLSLPSLPGAAITPQPSVFNTATGPVARADAQVPGVLSLNGGALPTGGYAAPINLPPSTSQSPRTVTGFEKTRDGDIIEHGVQTYQRPDAIGGTYQEAYARGGVIPEPVIGKGLDSGQTYSFGEEGPETIVPNEQTTEGAAEFAAAFFKALQDGDDGGMAPTPGRGTHGTSRFAYGGTVGYDPSRVPSLGSQSADLFNNPDLRNVVARGYNSSPQTPLFPQIGIATGGGQSLIPSMQRLNSLLPSEKSLYSGALQDEFGAQPNDVFALSKALAPGGERLRTPSFTN